MTFCAELLVTIVTGIAGFLAATGPRPDIAACASVPLADLEDAARLVDPFGDGSLAVYRTTFSIPGLVHIGSIGIGPIGGPADFLLCLGPDEPAGGHAGMIRIGWIEPLATCWIRARPVPVS